MDDIRPPKRSIRDISLPHTRKNHDVIPETVKPEPKPATAHRAVHARSVHATHTAHVRHTNKEAVEDHTSNQDEWDTASTHRNDEGGGRGGYKKYVWSGAGALVLLAIALFFFLPESGTVTVYSKEERLALAEDLQAIKATSTTDSTAITLPFFVIALSKDGAKTAPATGERQVTERAHGTIIVYNSYSTASQRLVKNTRFQTPDGLIYRVQDSVTVPGRTSKGGEVTPGQLAVEVYADEPGEKSNIGLTDFTIPGFKGDPRFTKIYGRSKTPMTGGFTGTVKTASPTDLTIAQNQLSDELKTALLKQLGEEKPADAIIYDKGVYAVTSLLTPADASDIKMRVNLFAIAFSRPQLSAYITHRLLSKYDSVGLIGSNLETLQFEPKNTSNTPWEEKTLAFKLSGDAVFTWPVDTEKLKAGLRGVTKQDAYTIFTQFPGIAKAEVVLRPFWEGKFPSESTGIVIKTSKAAEVGVKKEAVAGVGKAGQ